MDVSSYLNTRIKYILYRCIVDRVTHVFMENVFQVCVHFVYLLTFNCVNNELQKSKPSSLS